MSARTHLRLVLYSGGQEPGNASIHTELLSLALARGSRRRKARVRMTYVPFTRDGARAFFHRFERRYRAFGATHFDCFHTDDPALLRSGPARERALRTLLASDVVYLPGGNTFELLANLRRARLLPVLRRFARGGGVVAGLSAGAIVLTPDIGLAAWPAFDRDENEVGLPARAWGALGLVRFGFFPHFRDSARYREALQLHAAKTGRPIYACRDGSGLVIHGNKLTIFGDAWLIDGDGAHRLGT